MPERRILLQKRTESEQFFRAEFEQFWHGAIDGTLLSGAFRGLCIDNQLAKLCLMDRSRRVRIKNTTGRPNRFTECRE